MEIETLSITKARDAIADAVDRVRFGKSRFIFTKHGKPAAALISADDLTLVERLLEDAEDRRDTEAAREALADRSPTIPASDVRKQLGLAARKR